MCFFLHEGQPPTARCCSGCCMVPPRLAVPHDAASVPRPLRYRSQSAVCVLCESLSEQRLDKRGQPSLSCVKVAGSGGADRAVGDGGDEVGEQMDPSSALEKLLRVLRKLPAKSPDFSAPMSPCPESASPDPFCAPDRA